MHMPSKANGGGGSHLDNELSKPEQVDSHVRELREVKPWG